MEMTEKCNVFKKSGVYTIDKKLKLKKIYGV